MILNFGAPSAIVWRCLHCGSFSKHLELRSEFYREVANLLIVSSTAGPVSFVRRFSYKDIKKATDGFCRIIYSSAHGAAYKAKFRDGELALVKEIKDFEQTKDVFYREVQLLGRLHHRHLLPLIGFSMEQKSLLVFENIENGSLKDHLNDPLRTPLNWKTRRQIAVGVAAALEYLLLFNDPPIYHVSISSSNIMLDEDFTAKLSDVGFLGSSGNSTNAPHTKCSEDRTGSQCNNIIFQLGVLILELITGQSSEEGGFDLIQWVQENRLGGSVHNLIDPDLGSDYSSRELENLLDVARACIRSRDKPVFSAAKLLRYLQKKIDTPT
ncbi:probable receptor-like protein kinase At1g49730 isoform X2 [Punica granatum]|uniref:Probable receptor-like protein kinase At1g49730 isoform X2 n=1 Tax=Punica granatum TaxID=22663 RepID=A0A6P8D7Q8_PUNGR|nr:probable receptor-like protein kinase At1g49730 isoform X2 [Punica granatum]